MHIDIDDTGDDAVRIPVLNLNDPNVLEWAALRNRVLAAGNQLYALQIERMRIVRQQAERGER